MTCCTYNYYWVYLHMFCYVILLHTRLQDSYIIDNGEAGVWVWNGKQASKQERSEAMRNAVVSPSM